ncbi:hypothetical protein [Undibacterium crateris]|uniref:hypothetical protein n=1 Tax=Undibacterium crateris TaxID=2528175 RepID=UPI001389C6B7|nr:hypothetical protein [Undibacterium crateris]NDI84915.1 hypothetical protein [Undibacterium crateris]
MKIIGITSWILSLFFFLIGLWTTSTNESNLGLLFLVAIFFLMPVTLYNWQFGRHKNTPETLTVIASLLPLAIVTAFRHAFEPWLVGFVVLVCLMVNGSAVIKLRRKFPQDFRR